ncbi:Ig-like domain-containing protein, partial [Belliella aquatica]|uniref:Ig-like domain-containing protein n=1 Tax=Belliella aquatica TaxID=1323734 RepID=UPI00166294C6
MENIYNFLKNIRFVVLAVVLVLFGGNLPTATAQTQNVKPFVKRVGTPQPPNGVFNVRGDYTLVGNTNLTLQNYSDGGNNSNNVMVYVDVDGNPQTVNSSSANLVFSQENGADPNCSEILYAGLYWSGRATENGPQTFNVTKTVPGSPQAVNENQTLLHNGDVQFSSYSMSVSRQGNNNNTRYPRYTFSGNGNTYIFDFTNNSGNNRVQVRIGNGNFVDVPVNFTSNGDIGIATFNTPYTFTDGGVTITINSLTRDTRTNRNEGEYRSNSSASINVAGTTIPQVQQTYNLDKRKVKIKGPSASSYTELTANANNILYPQGAQADIYAGYVDVTNYVKQNGIGEYTVADIALVEGNGGNTGYFGQWGIIVVYENSKMPWRDITIFDGYSFVQSPGNGALSTGEFDITGFNAVQNGPVNFKLGVMAGEGDRGISGDFLEIRNASNSSWVPLSHPLNTTTNFFNSSIYTPVLDATGNLVQTPRSPNLPNNTGIDIAMWNVPNANNSIIGNSQTSTRFRYGTTQDLYSIYMVAFSVDAYVPDVEGLNLLTSLNGNPAGINPTVQPGEDITYTLEIRNRGTEAVQDLEVVIPIPFTASFSGDLSDIISQVNFSGGNAQSPIFDPTAGSTGSIIWKINNLPLPASGDPNDVLATLTYTLQATENCFVLAQADCEAFIETVGILRGKGAVSQSTFNSVPFITGFNNDGSCEGEPISTPVRINIINALDWVQTNCQGANLELDFFFCNVTAGIPVTEIRGNFPTGTQFFSGPDPLNDTEFNENNPFPSTGGQFFAIPPNSSECVFQFDIIVTIVTTNPDIPTSENLTFCQGENIGNLSQFISLSADGLANDYQLFYFTESTGGNAISNPVINTNSSGEVTFWVAEGPSSSCISDRVPVTITVNANTAEPAVLNVDECQQEGTVPYNVTALPNATLLFYADNNLGSLPFEATPIVDLSIAGINTVWVSQVVDGLCESARVQVSILVNEAPDAPVFTGNITECAEATIQTLSANDAITSSGSVVWYDAAIGGSIVTDPTLNSIGTETFYAEAVSADGCVSLERTAVTLTINDCRVAITKTVAEGQEQINAPTTLNYTINVTNLGNIPLSGVVVTDQLTNGTTALTLVSGDANNVGFLDTNETWVYTASYEVTQAMINAGDAIVNTAIVDTDQTGEEEAEVRTEIDQSPSLTITKVATEQSYDAVGDVINYTIVVTNTG